MHPRNPSRRALMAVPLVMLAATMPMFVEQSALASIRGASLTSNMVPTRSTVQVTNTSLASIRNESRAETVDEDVAANANKSKARHPSSRPVSSTSSTAEEEPVKKVIENRVAELTTNQSAVTQETLSQPAVNVLFGLSGNNGQFLSEFEVSLKSVLMNAPLHMDLNVHILADDSAYKSLPKIFSRAKLSKSYWATQITIHTYNVSPYVSKWKKRISKLYQKPIGRVTRHTIGAYFRLFANDVLPKSVKHVVYMDTDVVVMSNLGDLWERIDRNATFQWGRDHCSGFVVFNIPKLPSFWKLASEYNFKKYASGDQLILKKVGQIHPEVVAHLPSQWAISIGNGLWRHAKHIVDYRPKVGMFHFNGQGAKKASWWKNKNGFPYKFSSTFGNALYYVNLPWTWARFHGESLAAGGVKYKLVIQNHDKSTNSTVSDVREKEESGNMTESKSEVPRLVGGRTKNSTKIMAKSKQEEETKQTEREPESKPEAETEVPRLVGGRTKNSTKIMAESKQEEEKRQAESKSKAETEIPRLAVGGRTKNSTKIMNESKQEEEKRQSESKSKAKTEIPRLAVGGRTKNSMKIMAESKQEKEKRQSESKSKAETEIPRLAVGGRTKNSTKIMNESKQQLDREVPNLDSENIMEENKGEKDKPENKPALDEKVSVAKV